MKSVFTLVHIGVNFLLFLLETAAVNSLKCHIIDWSLTLQSIFRGVGCILLRYNNK
jgi:hypothetical protein